jgi:uncharacterized Tic20 family protein
MSSASGGRTEGVLAAAGWYPDSSGLLRWWDGQAWDTAKRGPGPAPTWAVLGHLSFFVLFLVPAIVLRVTVGRRDRFARHHTTEALNAQIWFAVIWNACLLPLDVISWGGGDPPVWAFIGVPLAFLALLSTAGLAIRGSVQAGKGIWWRYPMPFRFVPGSVRESDPPAS